MSLAFFLLQSSFCFVLTPVSAFARTQQETLTNQSVIDMAQLGISSEVILTKIKTSKATFDTSASALQSLKKAGVSDTVIMAMVQKASGMEVTNTATTMAATGNATTTVAAPQTTGTTTANTNSSAPLGFGLQDGTPVKLRIGRTMSSADAKTGETVDFEVLEDVKVGDTIVIPRGGVALGTVTQGKSKGRMGKGGKLDINIDSVRLADGEKVALRAVKETKGGSHTGAMTGAIVATSILFFPAAPFFLFMKGKDITIPKGTEITAYINGDTSLDASKFNTVAK